MKGTVKTRPSFDPTRPNLIEPLEGRRLLSADTALNEATHSTAALESAIVADAAPAQQVDLLSDAVADFEALIAAETFDVDAAFDIFSDLLSGFGRVVTQVGTSDLTATVHAAGDALGGAALTIASAAHPGDSGHYPDGTHSDPSNDGEGGHGPATQPGDEEGGEGDDASPSDEEIDDVLDGLGGGLKDYRDAENDVERIDAWTRINDFIGDLMDLVRKIRLGSDANDGSNEQDDGGL